MSDDTSIYGVNDAGEACMRVSETVTSPDPTSIYGVNDEGKAAMRVMGANSGGGGEVTAMIKNYVVNQNIPLLPVTSNIQPGEPARITFKLTEEEKSKWMVAGICSWELSKAGQRVEAIPIYAFTMENKTSIRMCFKTSGNTPVNVDHANIGILVIKRV